MEKRTTQLHGHAVAYRIAGHEAKGERPVLLLVHGMAGSSATWRYVMPALAERYTVIAPDLIGHGRSTKTAGDYSLGAFASTLRDLLSKLGVARATVVGQSLGGGVAMQLAYQHPERCERLVLVGSGGLGREVSWILRALTVPGVGLAMPLLFPAFARRAGNVVSRRLAARGVRAPHAEEEWRGFVSLTYPENRAAFLRTLRGVVSFGGQSVSASDRLYLAAHLPTLVVWGARDRFISVEHAYAAARALPASRLEIFERSGHFPHVEEPERFAAVLLDFLASTEPFHLDEAFFRSLLVREDAAAVDARR